MYIPNTYLFFSLLYNLFIPFKKNQHALEFPGDLAVKVSIVTALTQAQSLAWEVLHATGLAKKKKKNQHVLVGFRERPAQNKKGPLSAYFQNFFKQVNTGLTGLPF